MRAPSSSAAPASPLQLGLWNIVPNGSGQYLFTPQKPTPEATVRQAAQFLGVCEASIRILMEDGVLKFRKPSPRKTWISWESLQAYSAATSDPESWDQYRKNFPASRFFLRK